MILYPILAAHIANIAYCITINDEINDMILLQVPSEVRKRKSVSVR